MPKWSLTRLSYSLCSCWSPGYLVSVLTSHSLTCSTVLVHTNFGFVTFCFVDHVTPVLFFFSLAFLFCLWLVYQVPLRDAGGRIVLLLGKNAEEKMRLHDD